MKKVAVLTFHRSINYGAFLQCKSLCENIVKRLGDKVEVQVINYNSVKMELFYLADMFREYKILGKKIEQYNIFRRQLSTLNLYPQRVLLGISENRFAEIINKNYDAIIVGSDEVWKINYQRGFPNAYWLSRKISIPKLSYAASANRTNFDNFSNEDKQEARDRLSNFQYIGVRDINTVDIVRKIDDSLKTFQNPDPVILYDLSSEYDKGIIEKLTKKEICLDKPIIAILSKNKELAQKVEEHYKDNYQYVSMGQYNSETDVFLNDLTPYEWANIFKYFTITLTRLFHGTILSMKNHSRFIAVDMEEGYLKYTSKIQDLLIKSDLEERYFNTKSPEFSWDEFFLKMDEVLFSSSDVQNTKVNQYIVEQQKFFEDSFIKKLREVLSID